MTLLADLEVLDGKMATAGSEAVRVMFVDVGVELCEGMRLLLLVLAVLDVESMMIVLKTDFSSRSS